MASIQYPLLSEKTEQKIRDEIIMDEGKKKSKMAKKKQESEEISN
jgi:hypothetical protein